MSPKHAKAPAMIVFDVNETLSDMSPLAEQFETVGLPPHEREAWFAALLRDGISLTSVGENPDFAQLAGESLRLAPTRTVSRGRARTARRHGDEGVRPAGRPLSWPVSGRFAPPTSAW